MPLPNILAHLVRSSLNPRVYSPLSVTPHSFFHTSPIQCQREKPKPAHDPVVQFFARFPDFNYNSNVAWPGEWRRLRDELEEQLQRAAIERFHSTYGFDPSDLSAWQKMCKVVGIVPPLTLEGCRAAIKRLYINTVDLEHGGHRGNAENVPRFSNEVALREYSQRTGRLYRKDLEPARSLLKSLQRQCLDSRSEQAQMDARRKKTQSREA